jgi:hypothetical protein
LVLPSFSHFGPRSTQRKKGKGPQSFDLVAYRFLFGETFGGVFVRSRMETMLKVTM